MVVTRLNRIQKWLYPEKLLTLAKQSGVPQKTIDDILAKKGESKKRNIQEKRQYRSLLEGRFRAKVYRIQRQDDGDTIFGKASDFSYTTIKDLIDRGRRERMIGLNQIINYVEISFIWRRLEKEVKTQSIYDFV